MNIEAVPEFNGKWSRVDDNLYRVQKTIDDHSSSMACEDFFPALVCCARLSAFFDFLPAEMVDSILSSQQYQDHLSQMIEEMKESWPDSPEYIDRYLRG